MVKMLVLATLALFLVSGSRPPAVKATGTLSDNFDKEVPGRWRRVGGPWRIKGGKAVHGTTRKWNHDFLVADFPMSEGLIEVTGIAGKPNSQKFSSLGICIKYVDDAHRLYFRVGSHRRSSVDSNLPGFRKVSLGRFTPTPGRQYRLTVAVRNGLIGVCIDDVMLCILRDPLAGKAGRPGLFTESGARYDDFRVTRWAR